MAHELQLPQLAFAPASHRVFFNHVILERLVDVHPDVADLLALGATCRQLYHDIRYLLPRAQHLSFSPVKPTSSLTLARFLAHHLEGESGSPSRLRIVDDRRTVVVNGPVGAPYTTSWGRLRDLDLSGTSVSSGIINVLIGACAGGRVPEIGSWLNLNAYWQKDFLCGNNDSGRAAAKRILHDQALRLERLAFTNCPNVEIRNVVGFLLRILKSATQAERNRIREQQANSNSASNATLHPAAANTPAVLANIAAIPATQTTQVAYAGMMMGQAMPFHAGMPFVVPGNGQTFNFPVLVHAPNGSNILPGPVELARGDLANIPVPLPADADQLQAYNLPCLSLKRLDIANTSGLYVDDKYAGRSEWGNEWQFPQSHTLAYMQTVCGCLGIDIDVMFCQNYRCAQAVKDELIDKSASRLPMPRLSNERIIPAFNRTFRIPLACMSAADQEAAIEAARRAAAIAAPPPPPPTTSILAPSSSSNLQTHQQIWMTVHGDQTIIVNPSPSNGRPPIGAIMSTATASAVINSTIPPPGYVPPPVPSHITGGYPPPPLPLLPTQVLYEHPPHLSGMTIPILSSWPPGPGYNHTTATPTVAMSLIVPPPTPPVTASHPHAHPNAITAEQLENAVNSNALLLQPPSITAHTEVCPIDTKGCPIVKVRGLARVNDEDGAAGVCHQCRREMWCCKECQKFWMLFCGGCAAVTDGTQ